MKILKKQSQVILLIIIVLILIVTAFFVIRFFTNKNDEKIIEADTKPIETVYNFESPNYYKANENELVAQSLVKYEKSFGNVPDEKTAIKIAEKVLDEVYHHDCSKKEKPFVVFYNSNADAWIVNGTLPEGMDGGTGVIAIKKDTGKILLIVHYK